MSLSVPVALILFTVSSFAYLNQISAINTSGCYTDKHCSDSNQFCLHPGFSNSLGVCTSCWRCCLFPEVYGNCPAKCGCNEGQYCDGRESCGSGLFCSTADPSDMPKCQRCTNCTNDAHEHDLSCAAACASGDMSGLAALPHVTPRDYLFLAFLANEISQQGAMVPDVLLKDELLSWVQRQGATALQAVVAVNRMLLGDSNATAVSTQAWMNVVSGTMSETLLCPAYDSSKPASMQPTLTFEGCFCNATTNARSFRCPAGQRCSRETFHGLETDALRNPTAQLFQAVCVTCAKGQYCPEGTYVADETNLSPLQCPSGFYCPSPRDKRPCPAGYFCTGAAVQPITCNMTYLLLQEPMRTLPIEPESVVSRVRDKRDPTQGNYCNVGSTRPNQVCSAGYYCPNTSAQLICPRGHYCKVQSTAPWKCPLLTSCPEGTVSPRLSYMALVIAGIVIVSIPLIHFALMLLDNSVIMDGDEDGDKREQHRAAAASRMTFRLLKSIKLTSNPLENKYRGFGTVSPPITMEFESLGLQIRPRGGEVKNVLMGVSGSFAPRRLNAILGPSGCGKTTFLNVLCGKISNGVLMGQVRINGEDIEVARLKKITGFVPQDDIVHEDLTVRENLNYSARLRLPGDVSRARRRDVVHDALEMLGLSAIQHYRVGTVERRGISGGQRKRVNIGLELVAMPSLLFLDEPTSGLDATSSADILNSLADMANLGMNVVMVIHQPRFSSFLMFDQVLLLGGGGHTVYLGSPSAAMLYFTKYLGFVFPDRENPSDILMDIIAGKLPCAGDPRLKTCTQLVERWTGGGMAWVETLEYLNPTMTTKMSEVDPTIIEAIDDEFEKLDEQGTGQINAVQLVKLFAALHQEITIEDALILIRKINANRPASAKSTPRSAGTSSSGAMGGDDSEGLKITKQQLLDAFQGVREGNDENNADGAAQRKAAARFYASNFLLPDLPEVKPRREAIDRERRNRRMQYSGGGGEGGGDSLSFSCKDDTSTRSPGVFDTASAGYSSSPDNEQLDSDSYSPVGRKSNEGGGGGGGGGGTPVMESVLRRSTLSPVRMHSSGLESPRSSAPRRSPAAGVRTVALLPGLAGSVTSVSGAADHAANSSGGGAAAAASSVATVSGGGGGGASGVDDEVDEAAAAGDLNAYAAAVRKRDSTLGLPRWLRSQSVRDGGAAAPSELAPAGSYDSQADGSLGDAGGEGEGNGEVCVAPGLVATSLAAMEALAKADVPLPPLPRRAPDGRASATNLPGRSNRISNAFSSIASYVHTYNALGEAEEAAEAARAAATAATLMATASADMDEMYDTRRGSMLVSVGSRQVRRPSVKPAAGVIGGAAGLAAVGSGVIAAQPSLQMSLPLQRSLRASLHVPLQSAPSVGRRGTRQSMVALRMNPALGPAQLSVNVAAITEEEEYERNSNASGNDVSGPLPPLLRQLVSLQSGGVSRDVGAGINAGAGASSGGGAARAIAEALEEQEGEEANGQLPRRDPAAAMAAAAATVAAGDRSLREGYGEKGASLGAEAADPNAIATAAGPFGSSLAAAAVMESSDCPLSTPSYAAVPPTPRGSRPRSTGTSTSGLPAGNPDGSGGGGSGSGTATAADGAVIPTTPPGVTHLPPLLSPSSPNLTGDTVIHQYLAAQRQQGTQAAAGLPSAPALGSYTGSISSSGLRSGPRPLRMRTTRFAVSRHPTDAASLGMADLPPPEDASLDPDGSGYSTAARKRAGLSEPGASGATTPPGGSDHPTTVERMLRMRFADPTNNSAPQLCAPQLDAAGRSHVGGSGRVRRASMGAMGNSGRKQRRQSWLQQASDGSQDGQTPGGSRKRKDTEYVTNLLENALVGAWHQSVTGGRMNPSVSRLPHPLAAECGAGSPHAAAYASNSTPNTPRAKHTPSVTFRGPSASKNMAGGGTIMPASRIPSTSAMGGVMHSSLANKLDMEEALASRKAQGFFAQLAFLLRRGCIKYVRSFWPMRVVDTLLQLAAAFIIGLVHGTKWGITSVPSNTVMCMVCLGVLSCVTHLRTFSYNRVLLWRESSAGMSILAYYLSQNIIDQIWVFAAPALSLGVYYYLTLPRMPFSEFYVVGLFVCWWSSGMAYLVSAVLPPQNVLMAGVFIALIFGAFLNGLTYQIAAARGTLMEGVMGLSYNRWAMEIVSINEFKHYQNDQRNAIILMGKSIGLCGVDTLLADDGAAGISPAEAISFLELQSDFTMDYCNSYKSVGYVSMFSLGLGFRLFAFLFLWYSCWKKH